MLNYPYSKSYQNDIINNIFNSNKKLSKNNYINIKVQNNKIRRITPSNAIKKKLIPKITEKKNKSLNKKNIYKQFLERNFRKRYKSTNPSTLGLNTTNLQREYSNIYSKRKNKSECLNEKQKLNLLNSSIIKTINAQTHKNKNGFKYINLLSPTYGNMINLIPKMKNLLNIGLTKGKFSNSFSKKNNKKLKLLKIKENQKKNKNNYNIKRIVFTKRDNSRVKNLNDINIKKIKKLLDNKSDIGYSSMRIKNNQGISKKIDNNINVMMNNNKIKSLIKNHS